MKIRELLELTQAEPLAKIAKERLTIGEKTAREALKAAGCYSISGKRGWYYDGDPSVLEQSIYDFAPTKKAKKEIDRARKEVSATIEKAKAVNNPASQLSDNTENKQENKPAIKEINKPTIKQTNKQAGFPAMKKVTYEIEEQLHDQLKIKAIVEKRTVSEIVNEIIKRALS